MISISMAAGKFPDETSVRKPSGSKLYRVRRDIKIFGEDRQVIQVPAGLVYIVAEVGGGINAVLDSTELTLRMLRGLWLFWSLCDAEELVSSQ